MFSHGFINGPDGRKMSKSLGNVIDPHDMIKRFPIDSFRFYLARETSFGGDLNFSEANMMAVHNNELADVLVRDIPPRLLHFPVWVRVRAARNPVPPVLMHGVLRLWLL